MTRDPLTDAQRTDFEKQIVIEWRKHYATALGSLAFDEKNFGRAGDSTLAKVALQRVFCDVFLREDVLAAVRDWPK
jgi:hypothetical protein